MKNIIKKIITFLMVQFFCIVFIFTAFAKNNVANIDVDVVIKSNGSATITERWSGTFDEGTEVYKPIEDKSLNIRNFKVSKDGRDFMQSAVWDVNSSFTDKAWRYGINKTDLGVELCFGISSYGYNTYIFSYDVDPFVKGYDDYDGFNFQFVNPEMSTTPTSIMIKVRHENPNVVISTDNARIWGFGFEGQAFISSNSGAAVSSTPLNYNEYANIMMSFMKGIFAPNVKIDGSFDDLVRDVALIDSTYAETIKRDKTSDLIHKIIYGVFVLIFLSSFIIPLFRAHRRKTILKNFYNDTNYFRDTPNGGDIAMTHVLYNDFDIWKNKESNTVGAIIMKMINDKNLEPLQEKSYGFFGKEKISTSLKVGPPPTEPIVKELYNIIILAAGEDGILQENELSKYAKKNYEALTHYIESIENRGHSALNEKFCYNKILGKNLKDLNEQGQTELKEVFGLRKFLDEFTLISERSLTEGVIWENLLIYATQFGLAKKVLSELKKLYPEKLVEIQNYETTIYLSDIYFRSLYFSSLNARRAVNAARLATMAANGLGGAVSHGGGGGFSGGGHGGGTR